MKQEVKVFAIFSIIIILSAGFASANLLEDVGNFFEDVWNEITEISGKAVGIQPEVSSISEVGDIPTDPSVKPIDPIKINECVPATEICNNKDDDCDRLIDEELSRVCGTDIGECTTGIQTCSRGVWGLCVGAVYPKSEICNTLDDDCDNLIDEEGVCIVQNQTNQTVYHKICANNLCVDVQGAGTNECTTNSQCIIVVNQTHKECVGSSCISVSGAGVDKCTTSKQCIIVPINVTHKECVSGACVSVNGSGVNQCTNNSQCITQKVIPMAGEGGNDPVSIGAKAIEAQNAINAKGFDAASAVGTTFSDSVNPATGALTLTQTDVYVPGRNGMDIVLTRQYSSNVFLSMNAETSASGICEEINNIACNSKNPYENCLPPKTISSKVLDSEGIISYEQPEQTRNMQNCNLDSSYEEASSFKRARMLGTGWTINTDSRIKDPTPVLFDTTTDGRSYLTYRYLSPRGINSLSMVLDNNEEELILPAMYMHSSELINPPNSVGEFIEKWGNDIGDNGRVDISGYGDLSNNPPLAGLVHQQNNIGAHPTINEQLGIRSFPAYTSDLSPVYLRYPLSVGGFGGAPGDYGGEYEGGLSAIYFAKDGRQYDFTYSVPICGKFDDIKGTQTGNCRTVFDETIDNQDRADMLNWAENPYAGLYLTKVEDQFGNWIKYNYNTQDYSPFVNTIKNARGEVAVKYYNLDDSTGLNINSKINYIEFTGPKGEKLYRMYEYHPPRFGECLSSDTLTIEECEARLGDYNSPVGCKCIFRCCVSIMDAVPLLKSTYISEDAGPSKEIAGTRYSYEYDPNTKELIKVTLPTGAQIQYEYAWAPSIPAFDLTRAYVDSDQLLEKAKRVVAVRRVINGGFCETRTLPGGVLSIPLPSRGCAWVYQYKTVPKQVTVNGQSREIYELETTVYDPDGGKTVYSVYPTTVSTLNY